MVTAQIPEHKYLKRDGTFRQHTVQYYCISSAKRNGEEVTKKGGGG